MLLDKLPFTQTLYGLQHTNTFVMRMYELGMEDEILETALSIYPYYADDQYVRNVDGYIWDYAEYVADAVDNKINCEVNGLQDFDGKPVFDVIYALLDICARCIPEKVIQDKSITDFRHINSRLLDITLEVDVPY